MNEKKTPKKNKNKGKRLCTTCEYYDSEYDRCDERDIKNCSKQPSANFSQCGDYLVKDKLVMF